MPAPADPANLTAAETQELADCKTSTFMQISFRVADSAMNVLGNAHDSVVARGALEKCFWAGQEGIQSSLIPKLQLADWDRQGAISTHGDYIQLEDTGMTMTETDQAFYSHFTELLPKSLNLFITLYEDSTDSVDHICNKFAKYEMCQKVTVCFRWLCHSLRSAAGEEEGETCQTLRVMVVVRRDT